MAEGLCHDIMFRGMLMADGAGITVLKTNRDTRAGSLRRQRTSGKNESQTSRILQLRTQPLASV